MTTDFEFVVFGQLIDSLLDDIDGEMTTYSRVVDGLLDLRSAAGNSTEIVALVDGALGSIPGHTVAPNSWWMEQLGIIRAASGEIVRSTPVG